MANLSDLTRKEQVLARLQEAHGGWVNGTDLATKEVGGSEGLKRLRELRTDDGFDIRTRKHPDPTLDIWQYRLVPRPVHLLDEDDAELADAFDDARPNYPSHDKAEQERQDREVETALLGLDPEAPAPSPWPADHDQTPIRQAVKRREDGTFEYVPPQRAIIEPEQLTVVPEEEVAKAAIGAFTEMPRRFGFGDVTVCPRCHAKTTKGRTPKEDADEDLAVKEKRKKAGPKLIDEQGIRLYRDPTSKEVRPCLRCNGYGIVPNQGPIA